MHGASIGQCDDMILGLGLGHFGWPSFSPFLAASAHLHRRSRKPHFVVLHNGETDVQQRPRIVQGGRRTKTRKSRKKRAQNGRMMGMMGTAARDFRSKKQDAAGNNGVTMGLLWTTAQHVMSWGCLGRLSCVFCLLLSIYRLFCCYCFVFICFLYICLLAMWSGLAWAGLGRQILTAR